MFEFKSFFHNKDDKKEYIIEVTTDNYEQYLFIQKMAQECIDGKHKEKVQLMFNKNPNDYVPWRMPTQPDIPYVTTFTDIPDPCRKCPTHPSNGGSGICNCTLGLPQITC